MTKDVLQEEVNNLKSCPFCGCPADFGDRLTKHHRIITVGCVNQYCFCRMESKIGSDSAPHKVVKIYRQLKDRWNERKEIVNNAS